MRVIFDVKITENYGSIAILMTKNELQIKRGNRDKLGTDFLFGIQTYIVTLN